MYTRNFKRMVRLMQALLLVLLGSGLYIYHHFEVEQQESYRYPVAKNRNQDQIPSNRNTLHDSDYVLSANSARFMVQKDQRKKPLNTKNNLYDRLGQGVKLPSISGSSHGGRDGKNHLAYRGKESETPHRSKKITNDILENKEQEKSLCNIPFEYGQMCPTLYTDLGGYCERVEEAPQGFDCPDIRRKGYNNLRSTQLVLTRLLKIFDLVAREHGIKYWITSGTLLGATRHRGFIPWDEDADIEMTLDNYIKLFKCCKNAEFPEGVFFQNSETDAYLKSWNETENRLDRHPVVGLYKRLWNPRLRDTKSCTRYCLTYECKWVDGLMVDIFIAEDTLHPEHLRNVFPLKEMLFEGFRFPVPSNWKDILQYKYGNYESELGKSNDRIPNDNSDPFHSCEELKQVKKNKERQGIKRTGMREPHKKRMLRVK